MINIMRRIIQFINMINTVVGQAIMSLGAVLTMLVVYEVTVRYLFNSPTIWGMEVTQYILCTIMSLGGGYVLLLNGHINVDIFYRNFNIRTKAFVNLATSILLFFYLIFFIYETWHAAVLSMEWNETSGSGWNPPIYPVLFLIPVGGTLLLLQSISRFLSFLIQAITNEMEINDSMHLEI